MSDGSGMTPTGPPPPQSEPLWTSSDAPTLTAAPATPLAASGSGSAPTLIPGQSFGSYRIGRLLGCGGMGDVYEAEEADSGRRVALKLLNRPLGTRDERERFMREGRLAAGISHPHCVYVFGTDEIQGLPVISMELAAGGTLKDVVKGRGPLPPREAVDAILQVIDGLEAAAAVGVLHRDIKPANCFVDRDGAVKVGDFGLSISTLAQSETHLTMAGTILGTPAFASPEQLTGNALDVRSDIYSVGATLYYLLTGRAPFEESHVLQLVGKVLQGTPTSPRAVNRKVPSGLDAVVMQCLSKRADDRPATHAALREALTPYCSAAPVAAPLWLRFTAVSIDVLFTAALSLLVEDLFDRTPWWTSKDVAAMVMWLVVTPLYFGVLEGRWGRTAGRAACGLRVVGTHSWAPGIGRGLLRAFVWTACWQFPSLALYPVLGPFAFGLDAHDSALWVLGSAVMVVLLFCTARRANGLAGLHDLISRTRVVLTSVVVERPTPLALGTPARAHDVSTFVGPYQHVSDDPSPWPDVVVGYDPRLRRRVWIRRLPHGSPALSAVRRDLSRAARLRWLSGIRTPKDGWDAFEEMPGQPFVVAVRQPQSWAVVRTWMRDLFVEIEAASSDGTLPALAPDQLWVGADGRLRLLDWSGPHDSDLAQAQDFLLVVGRSALAGRVVRAASEVHGLPTGSLPLSAARFLEDLASHRFESFADLRAELARLTKARTQVSRAQRAVHVFLLAALAAGVPGPRMMGAGESVDLKAWQLVLKTAMGVPYGPRQFRMSFDRVPTAEEREALRIHVDELEKKQAVIRDRPEVRESRATDNERRNAALVAGRFADQHRAAVRAVLLFFLYTTVVALYPPASISGLCAIVGAFLVGGPFMRLLGIRVASKDGGRASRLRCAARAAVAWLPALAGTTVILYFMYGGPGGRQLPVSWTFLIAIATFALVFVGGAIYAVVSPQRGLQDRIAGTRLVPE
jgi:eukaryotic-like serine/threonine-protein kinase